MHLALANDFSQTRFCVYWSMSENLFQQFLIILACSLAGAMLLRRLRMATIVAYVAVGALLGPSAFNLVDEPDRFHFLAEFGVVFLLFTLGLEFSFRKMLAMRFAVFGVGGVQVGICTVVFAVAVSIWGATLPAAVMIAGSLALSSTAIVTRELQNTHQLHNQHGQLSVGVLLFQDLVAVVFLVLVPVLGSGESADLWPSLAKAGINTLLLLSILLAAGRWVLPIIYNEVARGRSEEVFLLSTLVIVLLAAWLTHSFHLSMALGGFVIGMMLGEGSYRFQIQSDIRPFRDILLGLFFVTIGMNLDLHLLYDYYPRIIVFTIGLILIKTVVVSLSVRALGFSSNDSLRVGLTLAQAGEFGLALMALALLNGVVPPDQASFITIIAIFSMVASPFLIRPASDISRALLRRGGKSEKALPVQLHLKEHVILGGFGRLGSTLAKFLDENHIPYIAIDTDIEVVERHRSQGKNIVYGDSNNLEILAYCHLAEARLVVLTFKSMEEGKAAIEGIRQRNEKVPVIVRCQEQSGWDELVSLGASHVFPELLESSLLISRQALELLEVDEQEIEYQLANYRDPEHDFGAE